MEQLGFYRVAIYCRLSQDDGQEGDSNSITTQKAMLEKYCKEQGFAIYDFYVDDGYSGLRFDRPDFTRMLNDIDTKKVNLVITKDLSRLGRDYIQTGYYTEIYFPNNDIRYIALHDGVDTLRPDNDIAPFKNILNDMYAKDLSRKVKSAKRLQATRGDFMSGQCAYGYKRDPNNKHKLVIDSEPAEVVREIYRLALTGMGTKAMAKYLKAKGYLTPSHYKVKQGDTRFIKTAGTRGECDWIQTTIWNILRDMVYVGDMENSKYQIKNYKTKKKTKVPKDQRIVVKDTHEAIIDREAFNRVQELISFRHRTRKHNYTNIFKSIVFCSECGYRLMFGWNDKNIGKRFYYQCHNRYLRPDKCRHRHYIKYNELYEVISQRLKLAIENLQQDTLVQNISDECQSENRNDKILVDKKKVETRLSVLDRLVKRLYEDYACEQLDMGNYQRLLTEYQTEQKTLNKQLQTITVELSKETDQSENLQKLKKIAEQYLDFNELTSNMLHQLIDRIEIGHTEVIDNEKRQEINIVYRFVG